MACIHGTARGREIDKLDYLVGLVADEAASVTIKGTTVGVDPLFGTCRVVVMVIMPRGVIDTQWVLADGTFIARSDIRP